MSRPGDQSLQENGSVRAATAVLLQLESAVDTTAMQEPDVWVLNGSSSLSRGECAQRLAAVPKPMQCRVMAQAGRLYLDCAHRVSAGQRASAAMFTRALFQQYAGVTGNPRLLVYGPHSTLVLTAAEAEEMFRDYELFFVSIHMDEPNESERAQGATAVLRAKASRGSHAIRIS
jgi:hypothetical protein